MRDSFQEDINIFSPDMFNFTEEVPFPQIFNESPHLFDSLIQESNSKDILKDQIYEENFDGTPFNYQEKFYETKKNYEDQKSTGMDEEEGFFKNQEPIFEKQPKVKEVRQKTKKERKKTCDDTKNLLINFRAFFVDYIFDKDQTSKNDSFMIDFAYKKSVNRGDYEELFKNERYRPIISEMFEERFLQRQFQLSRSQQAVRPIYLKKIPIFKKAFDLKWFPRIR